MILPRVEVCEDQIDAGLNKFKKTAVLWAKYHEY